MSYILHDPDEWETVHTHHVCAFHQVNRFGFHAGCTCSAGISQKRREPEEIARIKAERRRREEDSILAQAEIIKIARRAAEDRSKE